MSKMKALMLVGARELEIREVPVPELNEAEVLIEVAAVGVCGSELGGFLGVNALRQPPLIMGHEATGKIAGTSGGLLADGSRPEIGREITFNPLITCGRCHLCLSGKSSLCSKRELIGAHRPGAFAQFVTIPTRQCWSLPRTISLITGSLTEPVACAVRAINMAESDRTDLFWIIGAGPIGLSCLAIALDSGVEQVVVSDISEERLSIAENWGAKATMNPIETSVEDFWRNYSGEPPNRVIDAVGSQAVRAQAIRNVRPGGTIVLVGLHDEEAFLPCNQIVRNEISLQGSFGYTQADFRLALDKLDQGVIRVGSEWLEQRSLEEGQAVFEELVEARSNSTKIVLRIGDTE
jgi:threonine dehydrogenase-like Zn-dependent dehydrogenase